MCGLAGIFTGSQADPAWLDAQARAMAGTLTHRGPDDEGVWVDADAGIAFGFRRLSIIDLSESGHQPMRSASGRYTMVFNGEVFNHRALRAELASGARFRGRSDTETMLAAFEAWGIDAALNRFVGQFALGIWDSERRELHLVRDRLGIIPLYYAWTDKYFLFGSEMRALLIDPAVSRAIDPIALTEYLRYLYVPSSRSILGSVRRLSPGHHLVLKDGSGPPPDASAWWSLADHAAAALDHPTTASDADVVEEFDRLLAETVALQLESDVPLGALLSGGIDSSLVVAMMQAASSRPVKTFSIGFPGTEHDESSMARAVAAHLGTEHHELPVDDRAALDLVPRLAELTDEPFADPSQIPTLLVCQMARREVTVALTGDGGDELFAGYNRYVSGPGMIAKAGRMPALARRAAGSLLGMVSQDGWDRAFRAISPVLPKRLRYRLPGEKVRKFSSLLSARSQSAMYQSLLSAWQHPEALLANPGSAPDPIVEAMGSRGSLLDRAMLSDQQVYLPDDLLTKVDRMGMAVSLEARVPILDHRVVEYSWRLRPEHKIRNGRGKWILREVLYRRVPRALVDRPKTGFTPPIADWLRNALRPWAEEQISPAALARTGLLDEVAVRRAWREFHAGHSGHAPGLWAIMMLQSWAGRWGR